MGVNTGGVRHVTQSGEFIELLLTCLNVSSLSEKTADLLEVRADVSSITDVLNIILLRVPHVLMLYTK